MILQYFILQHHHPEVYATKTLTKYKHLLEYHSRILLEKRDKHGRAVLIAKLGEYYYYFVLFFFRKIYDIFTFSL